MSLYQLVEDGIHTHAHVPVRVHTYAHRANPHAADIQPIQFWDQVFMQLSLNYNMLLSESDAASDHWGDPVWQDQDF